MILEMTQPLFLHYVYEYKKTGTAPSFSLFLLFLLLSSVSLLAYTAKVVLSNTNMLIYAILFTLQFLFYLMSSKFCATGNINLKSICADFFAI
jgi:hypothetical protein